MDKALEVPSQKKMDSLSVISTLEYLKQAEKVFRPVLKSISPDGKILSSELVDYNHIIRLLNEKKPLDEANQKFINDFVIPISKGEYSGVYECYINSINGYVDMQVNPSLYQEANNPTQITKFNFRFRRKELEIPEEICGYKITPKDRQELMRGNMIPECGIKAGKVTFFLSIDPFVNTLKFTTATQLSIPKEFAGVKFSQEEMALLANGKMLPQKVYCIDGNYFLSNFQIHKNVKGDLEFQFMNYKDINNCLLYTSWPIWSSLWPMAR